MTFFHTLPQQEQIYNKDEHYSSDIDMTDADTYHTRTSPKAKQHTQIIPRNRRGIKPVRNSSIRSNNSLLKTNRRLRYDTSATSPVQLSFVTHSNNLFKFGPKKDFLSLLPHEIAFQIVSRLEYTSLCKISSVSRSWFAISRSNDIWKHQALVNWNTSHIPIEAYNSIDWYHLFKQNQILQDRWNNGCVAPHYMIGHTDSVYCLQFDKQKIITGSRDRTIKFWSLSTYQCYQTLQGHEGSVLCLKYNDSIIVSGSSDTTIIVWNMVTGQPLMRLQGHTAGVLDVCFDERYIVSCSKDRTIRIWDLNTGQLLKTILAHHGPVNAIQLVGNKLISASGDALIKMWDVTTGQCLRKYVGHTRGLACVRYNGSKIVSGSNDQTIKVWDAESGECLMTCEGHTDLVRTLHFNDERIVSASYDQSIRVWDIKTGTCLLNFQSGHTSWVFDVRFDSTKIVSASQDQRVLVMDFATGLDTQYF